MGSQKNIEQLKKLKKKVSESIQLDSMIFFGSRVYGKPTRYSDFDLLLVSPAFKKTHPLRRTVGIHRLWELDYPVDLLCYTPEEFKKLRKTISIVREAAEKGITI